MTFISNAKHMVPTLKLINWNFISCFYNFWGKKAREGKSEEAKSLRDGRVVMISEWKWKSLSRIRLFATPWYSPWNSLGQNTGVGSLLQGNLPNPEIESRSPALQVDSLPAEPPGKPSKKNRATKIGLGTSLVVQWLRLQALSAGGLGSIPGWGKRSHMSQLRPSTAK